MTGHVEPSPAWVELQREVVVVHCVEAWHVRFDSVVVVVVVVCNRELHGAAAALENGQALGPDGAIKEWDVQIMGRWVACTPAKLCCCLIRTSRCPH